MRGRFTAFLRAAKAPAAKLSQYWAQNSRLCVECVQVNANRVLFGTLAALPIQLINLLMLWAKAPADAQEARWRAGLLAGHAALLGLMILFSVAAARIRRLGDGHRGAVALQYAAAISLMAAGVIIAWIDQLVIPNITPFLVACLVVGTMLLIRPLYAFALYAAAFVAFFLLIDRGADPAIVLSNRVNGLTMSALGCALSIMMWRHFTVESFQRRQIEAQRAQLERVNRELEGMAFNDSLTGLPNRRYFDREIGRVLAGMARGGPTASVIELDIDHFKDVNDTYGHHAGDEVLVWIARLIAGAVRKSDLFARYGGEEFILLLPETPLESARAVAEKLRRLIEESVIEVEGHSIRVTASFGVAQLDMDTDGSYYRSVDRALYSAKSRGRNCVEAAPLTDPDGQYESEGARDAPAKEWDSSEKMPDAPANGDKPEGMSKVRAQAPDAVQ